MKEVLRTETFKYDKRQPTVVAFEDYIKTVCSNECTKRLKCLTNRHIMMYKAINTRGKIWQNWKYNRTWAMNAFTWVIGCKYFKKINERD